MNRWHERMTIVLLAMFCLTSFGIANDQGNSRVSDLQISEAPIPAQIQKSIDLRKKINLQHTKLLLQGKKQSTIHQQSLPSDVKASPAYRLQKEAQRANRLQTIQRMSQKKHPTVIWEKGGTPVPALRRTETTSLNLLVNGQAADTALVGEPITLTFSFPAGESQAELVMIFDLNENGVIDTEDYYFNEEILLLTDNDMLDSNPADGFYQLLLTPDFGEGLMFVQGGVFFEVSSGSDVESVYLLREGFNAGFQISGTATDEAGNGLMGIVVMGEYYNPDTEEEYFIIDLTDSLGNYALNLPTDGMWNVFSGDFLYVTDGLYPDPSYYEVMVYDYEFDYDFTYRMGNAVIRGFVADQGDTPIADAGVYVESDYDELNFYGMSDTDGSFEFNVPPGDYWVGVDAMSVLPDYMAMEDTLVSVADYDTTDVNMYLYGTNATISGNVIMDGSPLPGIYVWAYSWEYGWTETQTDINGDYLLNVYSDPTDSTFYEVGIDAYDLGPVIADPWMYDHVFPNSSGWDFVITTVEGGLTGYIIDDVSSDTLLNSWVGAIDLNTGEMYGTGSDWETGLYTLWLPDGTYKVGAGADGYMFSGIDTVTVAGQLIWYDFFLQPFDFVGDIHGQVMNSQDSTGIPYAWVEAWNNEYFFDVEADEYGFYTLELPAGDFNIWVYHWDYFGTDDFVAIQPNDYLERNYFLDPYQGFDGGMSGYVYDATTDDPLWGAEISVGNGNFGVTVYTDETGYYELEAPPGDYWVDVWAPEYNSVYDSVSISDYYINRDYWLTYSGSQDYGTISGTVYDTTTFAPIEGATVYIGTNDMTYGDVTFTDINGEFVFVDVPYNMYSMMVQMDGYYPGFILDFWVDHNTPDPYFELYLMPGTFTSGFTGVVTDENMNPVSNAMVVAIDVEDGLPFISPTDMDGGYFISVPNGEYELMVDKPGYYPWYSDMVYSLIDDTTAVDITLMSGGGPDLPPTIVDIRDVPMDQGKQVRLTFVPGRPEFDQSYIGYSVWRELALPTGPIWEFINYLPFHDMNVYTLVAPTLVDSNQYTGPSDSFWSTFMVSGHTHDPYYFVDSPPFAGYSVDNLVPHAPTNLTGTNEDGTVLLVWDPVDAPDLQYYSIYRGTTPGFEATSANRVAETAALEFSDTSVPQFPVYYRIAATDFSGNEGEHSNEAHITGTGISGENDLPAVFALEQNYPNPFNPTTTIRYAIPEGGMVQITVYNILGQRMSSLVNSYQDAGYYTSRWDGTDLTGSAVASGMYFYKIQVTNEAGIAYQNIRKMVLMH